MLKKVPQSREFVIVAPFIIAKHCFVVTWWDEL